MSILSAGAIAAAMAATPLSPPIEYLGYEPVHVIEVDVRDVTATCDALSRKALGGRHKPYPFSTILAGCQMWGKRPDPEGSQATERVCVIVIPDLWSLSGNKALHECIYNHEWAHCGGWPQGHPGKKLCDL